MRYLDDAPRSADIVIVGGGVVGAATAFHASRVGLKPLLLEARPRLCTLTTPASTGAFRLQFDNKEELALVRESVECFLHFASVTGQSEYDLGVRQQGYLWLTTRPDAVDRQRSLVEEQRAWGLHDVEWLSGEEARYRFPHISSEVLGARYRAADGFLDPKALTMGLAHGSNAAVLTGARVECIVEERGRVMGLRVGSATIETRTVIICAGPFSGLLTKTAGVDLPVEAVIRQKVIMPDVPAVPPDAPMTIDEDTGAHWRPALRGAYLLFTDPSTPSSPPVWDVPASQSFALSLLDPRSTTSVARLTPFWREVWERNGAHWLLQAGQYTMTPDHRPLIGATALEGLYVNTGYSGHGVMGSMAGSRILVDVLTEKIPPGSNPFWPGRVFEERPRDVL